MVLSALFVVSCASSQQPGAREPKTTAEAEAFVDPLPSWNDTAAKARIISFVDSVTDPKSDAYVTPAARIARAESRYAFRSASLVESTWDAKSS